MAIIKLHCLKTTDENGKNIFELCKNDESILRITFNPKKQTAKINSRKNHPAGKGQHA